MQCYSWFDLIVLALKSHHGLRKLVHISYLPNGCNMKSDQQVACCSVIIAAEIISLWDCELLSRFLSVGPEPQTDAPSAPAVLVTSTTFLVSSTSASPSPAPSVTHPAKELEEVQTITRI